MITYDNVQLKNAFNVAFLACKNDSELSLKPVYFKVGYKSEIGDMKDNLYVVDGDGGGYPRIVVSILERIRVNDFVEVDCEVLVANTYLRNEKGAYVDKSDVEGYGELYEIMAKNWAYLNGLKHTSRGLKAKCFKMSDLSMENDGYKLGEEILVVEGKFSMTMNKPKEWECSLKNWGDVVMPYLVGLYNPNSANPFPVYDIERYKR